MQEFLRENMINAPLDVDVAVIGSGSGGVTAAIGAARQGAKVLLIEKNGYVIGRGSRDNKGPVVMSLFVLRCLRDLAIPLRSTVRLIAGTREETDMQDVVHYLQTHQPPAFTLNCDGAWPLSLGEKVVVEFFSSFRFQVPSGALYRVTAMSEALRP